MRTIELGRELATDLVAGMRTGRQQRAALDQIRLYCSFIGYPRSGHSLVGSLLDAHRHVVVAHELDAVRYVHGRFPRSALFGLILRRDEEFTAGGRQWTEFNYTVPGQWQGRFESLRVIGDKKGGVTTDRLAERADLLPRLRRTVGVPVRFVHVIRNPFDNVATMARRRPDTSLPTAVETYASKSRAVTTLRRDLDPAEISDVRHEDLIAEPAATITELCRFLGVDAPDNYVEACASVVYASPRKSRHEVDWPAELRERVEALCAENPVLAEYRFDD